VAVVFDTERAIAGDGLVFENHRAGRVVLATGVCGIFLLGGGEEHLLAPVVIDAGVPDDERHVVAVAADQAAERLFEVFHPQRDLLRVP
jgi:hypothetical protein